MKYFDLYFCGFNGFKQFKGCDKLFTDKFEKFTINCETKNINIFIHWSYNAISFGTTLKFYGILEEEIKFDFNITKITGNDNHILILLENGDLYRFSFQSNTHKKLNFICIEENDNQNEIKIIDIECGNSMSIAITNDNSIYSIPTKIFKFPKHEKIKKIVCGNEHAVILTTNGDIYTFGVGTRGQLGIGELTTIDTPGLVEALAGIKIIDISAGGWHTAAVSSFGDLYTWGWNTHGQLGLNLDEINKVHPLPQLIDFDDELFSVKNVMCGKMHSVLITEKNEIYGAGWNRHGQLGLKVPSIDEIKVDNVLETKFKKINIDESFKNFNLLCGNWSTIIKVF